jgi:lincosamide nucleotidyltransferase A/C/D/E
MTSSEVLDLYSSLEILGVEIWIDGGWGVDALLGKQSRPHQDLDIAIQQKDLPICH